MMLLLQRIVGLKPDGIWKGRTSIDAVFVRKHNLEVNLEAVKAETESIPKIKVQDWLLLVEGHKKYHAVENCYLDEYIETSGIKTEDPIIAPFTQEIADVASIERIVAALSILTMDYLDLMEEHGAEKLNENLIELMFDQSLNVVAKAFEVSPKRLKKEFLKLKWHDEEALAKQLLLLSERRKQLISESNSQSSRQLEEILNRNRHPNLFIMSGIEHATIFTH